MQQCGLCGREWNGTGQAHCKRTQYGGCCEHFNSTAAFDMHRRDYECIPVEEFGKLLGKKNPKPRLVALNHPNGPIWATGRLVDDTAALARRRQLSGDSGA